MSEVERFLDELSTSGNVVPGKDQASIRYLMERASGRAQKYSAKVAVQSEEGRGVIP